MKIDDDDFTLFGLPRRFALDRATIDERRRALQSEVHPDRFAAQGPTAQRLAMQWAVRVNEAHGRLRDPLRRAAYLCELAGHRVDPSSRTALAPEFLVQQMQWREALEEADRAEQISQLDAAVAAEERDRLARLESLIDEQHDFAGAADQVRALMFIARFREDADRRLAVLE